MSRSKRSILRDYLRRKHRVKRLISFPCVETRVVISTFGTSSVKTEWFRSISAWGPGGCTCGKDSTERWELGWKCRTNLAAEYLEFGGMVQAFKVSRGWSLINTSHVSGQNAIVKTRSCTRSVKQESSSTRFTSWLCASLGRMERCPTQSSWLQLNLQILRKTLCWSK